MGKRVLRELSCELTPLEKAERSDELAAAISLQQELDDERKAFLEQWKDRRTANDRRILRLARAVRTGHEQRPVECDEQLRYSDRKVDIYRLDKGEFVCTRDMERADVQTVLLVDDDQGADLVH